jgi:hypothetical protein
MITVMMNTLQILTQSKPIIFSPYFNNLFPYDKFTNAHLSFCNPFRTFNYICMSHCNVQADDISRSGLFERIPFNS